jgi:hypothetical protein
MSSCAKSSVNRAFRRVCGRQLLAALILAGTFVSAPGLESRARAAEPAEQLNPRLADAPLTIERDRTLARTNMSEGPQELEPAAAAGSSSAPADVPTRISSEPELVRVAVGIGPCAPGSRAEKELVKLLEGSARASNNPQTDVRRLRAGAGDPRRICRERRDDLIIMVDFIADRTEAVLVAHDCTLDRALGIRATEAAGLADLVPTLWDEHHELLRQGVQARRAGLAINPKVRTGLIAGAAILVVGAAVGLIVASTLRSETVVITVGP